MDQFNLNNTCPFDRKSTKHYSTAGNAPDLREARIANKTINTIVGEFVGNLEKTDKQFSEIDIQEYDIFAKEGVALHNHVPGSLSEIFPIPENRNSEYILQQLEGNQDRFAKILLKLHYESFLKTKSHLLASREVMQILRNNFESIFLGTLEASLLRLENFKLADDNSKSNMHESDSENFQGIIITPETKDFFVQYQNMQERFESPQEVQRANKILSDRPEIIRSILGIQKKICEFLKLEVEKNPQLKESSIAFGEIALFDNTTDLIPSSRFLKIILHNWGKYFGEDPTMSVSAILKLAINSALKEEIYFQNIAIFKTENNHLILKGITPKVCPARTLIGRMINHYL